MKNIINNAENKSSYYQFHFESQNNFSSSRSCTANDYSFMIKSFWRDFIATPFDHRLN